MTNRAEQNWPDGVAIEISRDSSVDRMEIVGSEILAHAIDHNFSNFDVDDRWFAEAQIDAHRIMSELEYQLSREALRRKYQAA